MRIKKENSSFIRKINLIVAKKMIECLENRKKYISEEKKIKPLDEQEWNEKASKSTKKLIDLNTYNAIDGMDHSKEIFKLMLKLIKKSLSETAVLFKGEFVNHIYLKIRCSEPNIYQTTKDEELVKIKKISVSYHPSFIINDTPYEDKSEDKKVEDKNEENKNEDDKDTIKKIKVGPARLGQINVENFIALAIKYHIPVRYDGTDITMSLPIDYRNTPVYQKYIKNEEKRKAC